MSNSEAVTIAKTIKNQIGFSSWAASGARTPLALDADNRLGGIQFTTGTGHHVIRIELDYNDTYTVSYLSKRTGKVIHTISHIHCDLLPGLVYDMTHKMFDADYWTGFTGMAA
jgi:hypothetical protein